MSAISANSLSRSAVAMPRWGLLALAILFFGSLFYVRLHSFHKSIEMYQMEEVDAGEELEGGTRNTEKTAAFLLMAVAATYCILAITGARYELRWVLVGLLAVHLAMCVASITWSANLPMSLRRVAMVIVCALAAAGLARQFNYRELLIFMVGLASCYATLGVFAEAALGTLRPWDAEYRFAGTVHPNEQGMVCGAILVGAVLLSIEFRRYRIPLYALASAAAMGLVMTKSRTALVGAAGSLSLASLLLMPARYWPHLFTFSGFSLASVVGAIAVLPSQVIGDFGKVLLLGRSEDASSLTGRLPVWQGLMPHLQEQLWLGFGYRAFWDKARVEEFRDYTGGWQVPDSHNSYLEMILNVGVIGAAPFFLAMFIALVILCSRATRNKDIGSAFFAGLILSLFIGGFAEATLFNNSMFSCLMATCAVARLALHRSAVDPPLTSSTQIAQPSTLQTHLEGAV